MGFPIVAGTFTRSAPAEGMAQGCEVWPILGQGLTGPTRDKRLGGVLEGDGLRRRVHGWRRFVSASAFRRFCCLIAAAGPAALHASPSSAIRVQAGTDPGQPR